MRWERGGGKRDQGKGIGKKDKVAGRRKFWGEGEGR